MKTFVYMGHNDENVSRVSWKIWKIERKGKVVTVWWGPAIVKNRKPIPSGVLQSKSWRSGSLERALLMEQRRIDEKLRKGYERLPRRGSK